MEVRFIHRTHFGKAEYDPETDEYSWTYEGDNEKIIEFLELLDDGPHFTRISDVEVISDGPMEPITHSESFETGDWEYQMEQLARYLRRTEAHDVTLVE